MKNYQEALKYILENGTDKPNRTGIDQRGTFGMQLRFDLSSGFPAMTTKKLAFKQVVAELLWFISGSCDNKELQKLGCHIWDANAEADYWKPKAKFDGDLGRVYGVQWRHWRGPNGEIDQLKNVIEKIKNDPYDRRLIVSAWNPGELDMMALPPCHVMYQFYVGVDNKLSLQMYQRSADMFLGVPFNIASYALLLSMVAQVTNLQVGEFIHVLGDAHIYHNHFDQVKEQISRKPYKLPQLLLNQNVKDIDKFKLDDIQLANYKHHPKIKAKMAV